MVLDSKSLGAIAALGKLGVEIADLTRDEKELRKAKIECASNLINALPHNNRSSSVFGLTLQEVVRIKEAAWRCGVDKVVAFPVPMHISTTGYLIKCYGGGVNDFMARVNIVPIADDNFSVDRGLIFNCEDNFGVVIYERKE